MAAVEAEEALRLWAVASAPNFPPATFSVGEAEGYLHWGQVHEVEPHSGGFLAEAREAAVRETEEAEAVATKVWTRSKTCLR